MELSVEDNINEVDFVWKQNPFSQHVILKLVLFIIWKSQFK